MGFQVVIVYELEGSTGYAELRRQLEALNWSFHRDGMPLPRMCCWAEFDGCDTAAEAEQAAESSFIQALAVTSRQYPRTITPLRLAFMAFWPPSAVLKAA